SLRQSVPWELDAPLAELSLGTGCGRYQCEARLPVGVEEAAELGTPGMSGVACVGTFEENLDARDCRALSAGHRAVEQLQPARRLDAARAARIALNRCRLGHPDGQASGGRFHCQSSGR